MQEQKKYLIIYHREDNDGLFSGALFYDYLTNVMHYNLTDLCFIGADYNMLADFANENTPEQLHNDFENIIMTDISFNDVKYMKKLYKEFGTHFTWCDHHAPIIKASFENHFDETPGIRDSGRSAILCVWKYLYDQFDEAYNEKKVPELLRILSAYDSWTYEKEGYDFDYVRNINKGITDTYKLELGMIKILVRDIREVYLNNIPSGTMSAVHKDKPIIDAMFDRGKLLNDYDDSVIKDIIDKSGDFSWKLSIYDEDKGRPLFRECCVIFHQGQSSSTFFKSLKKSHPTVRNGLVLKHQPNGNWTLSIYNVYDDDWFHCGEFIKKAYNGGGHKGAAGCTLTEKQFIKLLKDKVISVK